MDNRIGQQGQVRRQRRILLILVLVFFGPLAVAWILYVGPEQWHPSARTHAGDLIDPPHPLPQVVLTTVEGAQTEPDLLLGKWTLIYVGPGDCDSRCEQALVDIRQIRLALAKDMNRVQRLFLFSETCCDRTFVETEHPGLIVAWADELDGEELLDNFPVYQRVPVRSAGRIYLVDPLGNLMMSYGPEVPAESILKDMKRLLRLSQIG